MIINQIGTGGIEPNLEVVEKTYTPTESQQTETITPSSGYNGIEEVDVTVNAIPSNYVGSSITRRDDTDLSVSGATVTVPSGYYADSETATVASGTAGTPTATKGVVSGHAVTVTPSVTNTSGYITGSTISGTGVSVAASELVSGTKSITSNGSNIDVTNYAAVDVSVSGGGDNTLVITLSWDDDYFGVGEGAYVPDCTFADVEAAHSAGKTITVDGADADAVADGMWVEDDEEFLLYSVVVDTESLSYEYLYTFYNEGDGDTITLLGERELINYDFETVTKTYTPTESQITETITPSGSYTGIEEVDVTVNAISSSYVGSAIDRRDSTDLSASGATVSVPSGYYASNASKSVASGTEGTPTATKGTVSSHAVTVTPSVTNVAGYISGGTHTGTGVSVSASELVSGTKSITSNGTGIDVTDYAAVDVAVPVGGGSAVVWDELDSHGGTIRHIETDDVYGVEEGTATPSTSQQVITPTTGNYFSKFTVDAMPAGSVTAPSTISGTSATVSTGTNTLTLTKSVSVTPNVTTAGYISSGTAGNSSVSLTASVNTRSSSDLTVSGATVSVPSGYYASNASKAVASGSVTAPSSISGTSATVGTGTNTLTLSKTISVTPSVTTAGYVSSGTAGNTSVSLTASVTTQGAQTIHPSTSDQTISSGRYLTGTQTIKAVTTTNLSADNIKNGVTVQIGDSSDSDCVTSVTGTYSGGSGKNVQYAMEAQRVNSVGWASSGITITVAKTGTYNVSWAGCRSSSSTTMYSSLYKNGTAGSSHSTFQNNYFQYVTLENQSYTQGDVLTLYGQTTNTSRYLWLANLIIEEQ